MRELDVITQDRSSGAPTAAGKVFEDDLVVTRPPALPAFPCFVEPHAANRQQGTTSEGNAVVGKSFVKQRLMASPVEFEAMAVYAPTASNSVTHPSRKIGFAVDSDDVIPMVPLERATTVAGLDRAIRNAPPSARRASAPVHRPREVAEEDDLEALLAPPGQPNPDTASTRLPTRKSAPKPPARNSGHSPSRAAASARTGGTTAGGGDIFDIDALY